MNDNQSMDEELKNKALIGRFIELRKKYGPTQMKFGKKLGLSDGTISTIEAGIRPISEKHIRLICGALGISEVWFREGTGPMLAEEAPGEKQLLDAFRSLSPEGRRLALKLIENLLESEKERQDSPDAAQNAPEDKTLPLEAPKEAKEQESTA
jgi:transcriptional regulator with XRE-family HTH domain